MELILNIYQGRDVEKTYRTDTCDIMFGTVEDILEVVDLDKLDKGNNEIEIAKTVVKSIPKLKDLLKDIFPELTDQEIKRTKIKELVPLFIEICKFSITGIMSTNEGK